MKIGEVAKRLDIPSSTIRYYEKRGLLAKPERVSGVREFSEDALATLRFIQLGQAAGFTIQELQVLIERYINGATVDRVWQSDVEAKRIEIRQKIKELEQADAVLGKLMNCQCKTIEQCVSEGVEESGCSPMCN